MFIHTFGAQASPLWWSQRWEWRTSAPWTGRTPGDTRGCFSAGTTLQPPARRQMQLHDSWPHLPEPLDVSIKRQRQREHDRCQQDHKVALREDVTGADCSTGQNMETGNVSGFVCFFKWRFHCLYLLKWVWDTWTIFCKPPGILWNTLVSVSPVVML